MSFYDKIRNAGGEMPEAFGMGIEQVIRINKSAEESEPERFRRHICEAAVRIRSERRLLQIFTAAHRAFLKDRLEWLDGRQD